MAGSSRIAGIASLFVDGVAVTAKGSLKYKVTPTVREVIMAMDGSPAGYSEKGDATYMSCTLVDTGSFKVADLFNNTNIQVIAQLANGKIVTGHSMTVMEALEVDNDEASFDVKFVASGPNASVVEALPNG